jgi:hypothetical protein
MRNMFLFNSHVSNMMFFTCCLCFAMIWDTMGPSLSCSITKFLISYDKWVVNANLSPMVKSRWTCRLSWLTWFCWMKHNFDTCLSKYNVLMVNSILHPFFIEPSHFFLKSYLLLWPIPGGIIFPLMSNFFG